MIRVTLDGAAIGTGRDAALPPVSASFGPGAATLLATEGGNRPTIVSLVASGRMKAETGSVSAADAEGRALSPARLRRAVALIDTPLVAEHSADVSVATVVREELALARSHRRADRPAEYSDRHDFGSLPADHRLRLLIDLALRRPDVAALVITSPERHGGDPARWWRVVRETATRGVAVLVVTDAATVAHLERLPRPEPVGDDALTLFDLSPASDAAAPLESLTS
jgi:ABC-2 type transport system ATP-binding protein